MLQGFQRVSFTKVHLGGEGENIDIEVLLHSKKADLGGEEDAPTTSVDVQPPQLSSAGQKQSKEYSRKHFNYR